MSRLFQMPMFSPEAAATAGISAPVVESPQTAAAPTGTTSNQAVSPATPPQSSQPTVSISAAEHAELLRFKGQATSGQSFVNRVTALGMKPDEAYSHLEQLERIRKDPTSKGIFDALVNPVQQPQQQPPQGQQGGVPDVGALVKQEFQAYEQKRMQAEYQQAAQTESRLLQEVVNAPDLKPIFGEVSFDDAFAGKGTPVARAVATLMDAAIVSVAPRMPNGQPAPITDPAVMQSVKSEVLGIIQALKASAIMDASNRMVNGQPKTTVVDAGVQVQPTVGIDFKAIQSDFAKRLQAVGV